MKKLILLLSVSFSSGLFANSPLEAGSLISTSEILKLFASLGSVIFLVFIVAFLFKKMNSLSLGGADMMKITSSLCVGHKEKIVLLEVAGENLLLGVTPNGISLLSSIESSKLNKVEYEQNFPNTFKQFFNKGT